MRSAFCGNGVTIVISKDRASIKLRNPRDNVWTSTFPDRRQRRSGNEEFLLDALRFFNVRLRALVAEVFADTFSAIPLPDSREPLFAFNLPFLSCMSFHCRFLQQFDRLLPPWKSVAGYGLPTKKLFARCFSVLRGRERIKPPWAECLKALNQGTLNHRFKEGWIGGGKTRCSKSGIETT